MDVVVLMLWMLESRNYENGNTERPRPFGSSNTPSTTVTTGLKRLAVCWLFCQHQSRDGRFWTPGTSWISVDYSAPAQFLTLTPDDCSAAQKGSTNASLRDRTPSLRTKTVLLGVKPKRERPIDLTGQRTGWTWQIISILGIGSNQSSYHVKGCAGIKYRKALLKQQLQDDSSYESS